MLINHLEVWLGFLNKQKLINTYLPRYRSIYEVSHFVHKIITRDPNWAHTIYISQRVKIYERLGSVIDAPERVYKIFIAIDLQWMAYSLVNPVPEHDRTINTDHNYRLNPDI